MEKIENHEYQRLIQALQLLALDPEAQIKAFPSFVVVTDELAIGFANTEDSWASLVQDKLLTGLHLTELKGLLQMFNQIGKLPAGSGWTVDALRKHAAWSQVRTRSSRLLKALKAPAFSGELQNVAYIQ